MTTSFSTSQNTNSLNLLVDAKDKLMESKKNNCESKYICSLHPQERIFSNKKSFIAHNFKYHNTKECNDEMRTCPSCGRLFATKDSRNRHMKKTCPKMGRLGMEILTN
jgi:uncharacterized C2H2 Zn-finger protein